MPELGFFIEGIAPRQNALTPALSMGLRIVNGTSELVHSLLVRCQVQIDAPRRTYTAAEQRRLQPVFAEPERWDQSLRPLHWQTVSAQVGSFRGTTVSAVELPCSLDFSLAATQYLAAANAAPVPLRVYFSGTLFYEAASGLKAAPINWDREAVYRLPAGAWQKAIAACFGDTRWLPLDPEVFERLLSLRAAAGHTSWEQMLRSLMAEAA